MAFYEGVQKKAAVTPRAFEEHRCRSCGRPAIFSDDLGKTWMCREHCPPDFFPHMRSAPVRKRRAEPVPTLLESDEF
jgi:ribosomal protein L37AE/L43A